VPQDSADVWWPARGETAYGWREFLEMFVKTKFTMSRRMGAVNTAGRGSVELSAPV